MHDMHEPFDIVDIECIFQSLDLLLGNVPEFQEERHEEIVSFTGSRYGYLRDG
jgi:hypothetical protein